MKEKIDQFKEVPVTLIENLSEYINFISKNRFDDLSSPILESGTLYRGQSNSDWGLIPSLYRENLLLVENLMLKKMQHLYPDEFIGNRLGILAKMQHFGMPTRLLDTTKNPLVALYFACNSEHQKDKDGIVYVFPNVPILWSTDPYIEIIMDFVFGYSADRISLDNLLKEANTKKGNLYSDFNLHDTDSLLRILTHPAYAVMPIKNNPRIKAQDGAFYLFGMQVKNKTLNLYGSTSSPQYSFEPITVETPKIICSKSEVILIPAQRKKQILEDLDQVGISEDKLFPDLPHQINCVVKSVRNNITLKLNT